jgi:hypothetical protein
LLRVYVVEVVRVEVRGLNKRKGGIRDWSLVVRDRVIG